MGAIEIPQARVSEAAERGDRRFAVRAAARAATAPGDAGALFGVGRRRRRAGAGADSGLVAGFAGLAGGDAVRAGDGAPPSSQPEPPRRETPSRSS